MEGRRIEEKRKASVMMGRERTNRGKIGEEKKERGWQKSSREKKGRKGRLFQFTFLHGYTIKYITH